MSISWDDRRFLVTGGAGFIGSFLTEKLVDKGTDIVVADDLSRGRLDRIEHILDDIEFRSLDLITYKGCIETTGREPTVDVGSETG
jgi:nucleoside-diphosphate-sugar epimerase